MNKTISILVFACIASLLAVKASASPAVSKPQSAGHYTQQAEAAMTDLIKNFWIGSPDSGSLVPTYNGYSGPNIPVPRGMIWERGLVIFDMDTLYQATGDPVLKARMTSEWKRFKTIYSASELETAGTGVNIHPASDDTGWDANVFLDLYEVTGDPYALQVAEALVDSGFKRWQTDDLGGGIWYNDDRKWKSLYEVGLVLSSLRIYKQTHKQIYYNRAVSCYAWMESHLLRPDGFYWCDMDKDGPLLKERYHDIFEGGSVTFLAGNMAMGVLHAWFYRATGNPVYFYRANRTAEAIFKSESRGGVFLNDRDAWSNGTFAGQWAKDVLTLPHMDTKYRSELDASADSIYRNARTSDGYYGGCWQGPADGDSCPWSKRGFKPQQIDTSGSSANVIMAAALLEKLDAQKR